MKLYLKLEMPSEHIMRLQRLSKTMNQPIEEVVKWMIQHNLNNVNNAINDILLLNKDG